MSDDRRAGSDTREGSPTDGTLISIEGSDGDPELTVDGRVIRQRAVGVLEGWERDGLLDQVRARTRTVTAVALLVFVLSAILSSSEGLTGTVAVAWFAVSGVVTATVGAVTLLLRGLQQPRELVDEEGLVAMFAIALLAFGGTHYRRSPVSRAVWRYFVTGPVSRPAPIGGDRAGGPDVETGSGDRVPLRRYVRLAGWLSAALIVGHQGWLTVLSRETVFSRLFGPALDAATGAGGSLTGLGSQLAAWQSALVLAGAVLGGTVIGAFLAVSRD